MKLLDYGILAALAVWLAAALTAVSLHKRRAAGGCGCCAGCGGCGRCREGRSEAGKTADDTRP